DTLWVEWSSESALAAEGRDWRVDMLKAAVSRDLEPGLWRTLRAAVMEPDRPHILRERQEQATGHALRDGDRLGEILRRMATGPSFEVAVQLDDGSWVNFVVPFVSSLSYWSTELVVALGLSIVVV